MILLCSSRLRESFFLNIDKNEDSQLFETVNFENLNSGNKLRILIKLYLFKLGLSVTIFLSKEIKIRKIIILSIKVADLVEGIFRKVPKYTFFGQNGVLE